MPTIFIVSDGTGQTAERMVRAALIQFKEAQITLVRRDRILEAEQVRAVVAEAAGQGGIVMHTLVSDKLRALMLTESRQHGVDAMDLMGPLLERLAVHLHLTPQQKPGLFQQLAETRSREIEAVAFAFRHDDGQYADELERAEVVLVGASRTMKTPTMLYLAYHGWFAANVPLVLGLPVPASLRRVTSQRVFCMTLSPDRMLEWRRVRASMEAIPVETYASMEQVRKELAFCQQAAAVHRWPLIDVTGKSVEEVGREIITLLSADRANAE
jgi:[pyruvate, water dikinase]-phosphate phosphotransferase / [pyruvate, water dikinase] kinase